MKLLMESRPIGMPVTAYNESVPAHEGRTYTHTYGPVAQLEERIHGMDEVRGSIPLRSTPLALM